MTPCGKRCIYMHNSCQRPRGHKGSHYIDGVSWHRIPKNCDHYFQRRRRLNGFNASQSEPFGELWLYPFKKDKDVRISATVEPNKYFFAKPPLYMSIRDHGRKYSREEWGVLVAAALTVLNYIDEENSKIKKVAPHLVPKF